MKINSLLHKIRRTYSLLFPEHIIVDSGNSSISVMTFDDGPCQGKTEKILSILESYDIKSTFFLTGEEAEKYKDIVKLIFTSGHQLANHGYTHQSITEIGSKQYIYGVEKTHSILEEITDSKLKKVFRPPYGEMKLVTSIKLIKLGYQFVLWSYDTNDSYLDSAEKIVEHMQNEFPRKSEIFLMHDDYERNVIAIPKIFDMLLKKGHLFSRLDEVNINEYS